MGYNKLILVGYVGKDPEFREFKDSKKVTFSLAVTEGEITNWFNIEFWNKQAELIAQHVKKGSQLLVEGQMFFEAYEKDGVKTFYPKVKGHQFKFLDKKNNNDIPF